MASYYDIDAILTDAQKAPCTFELDVPGLGYLEGNPGQDIKTGAKIELPLWLAYHLAMTEVQSGYKTIALDNPTALSPRVMNALKADPKTIDVRALAPNFYSLGEEMLTLYEDDEMVEVLSDTFKKRAAEIADQANNPRGALGEGADFLRGLEESERQLFRAAHDSSKAVKQWMADVKKT